MRNPGSQEEFLRIRSLDSSSCIFVFFVDELPIADLIVLSVPPYFALLASSRFKSVPMPFHEVQPPSGVGMLRMPGLRESVNFVTRGTRQEMV